MFALIFQCLSCNSVRRYGMSRSATLPTCAAKCFCPDRWDNGCGAFIQRFPFLRCAKCKQVRKHKILKLEPGLVYPSNIPNHRKLQAERRKLKWKSLSPKMV